MSRFRANREVAAVFVAKAVRTFTYGYLGILLPLYLADLGLSAAGVGAFVTLTLAGSAALTWGVRVPAERLGARAALLGLAALSIAAGVLLLFAQAPWMVAAALGAAVVGALTPRGLFAAFLVAAIIQALAYTRLPAAPAARRAAPAAGPGPSAATIRRLAALFALDSFAGGFVLQSLVAYFLHVRFGLGLDDLGQIFFVAQLVTAASLLLAARFALRFGLLNTMVVSHLASNVFLIAIAFAPSAWLAVMA